MSRIDIWHQFMSSNSGDTHFWLFMATMILEINYNFTSNQKIYSVPWQMYQLCIFCHLCRGLLFYLIQHFLWPTKYKPTLYLKNNNFCNYLIIRSSHTVCGHEALQLAKCLTEELANQATQGSGRLLGNRVDSPEPEPRARSYDQKSPQKNKGSFYAYVFWLLFDMRREYITACVVSGRV